MAKTQRTTKGLDIPIPKRGDFFGALKKATAPEKSVPVRRAPKKR